MGDRLLGLASLAIIGAIIGDALINYQGTSQLLTGITNLATATYTAAAGGYSKG